jgi:hypothetical protein
MPADGFLVGLPHQTLIDIRDKALSYFLEGKTIMSWSDGSTNVSKQFAYPPDKMLEEAQYALQREAGRVRTLYTNYNRTVDR